MTPSEPPVCGLVILMAASPQAVPYQGLDRELAMTLTLLVLEQWMFFSVLLQLTHGLWGLRDFREPWS